MSSPQPQDIVCLCGRGPIPRRSKSSSYNLHFSAQPSRSLFTGFPQQELPPVEGSVETSAMPAAPSALHPGRTGFTPGLRESGTGSMARVLTTQALVPGAPSAVAGLEAPEALLLELEAALQGANRCAGPRTHGDMPQAHGLRPSTCGLRLPRHRAHWHPDLRGTTYAPITILPPGRPGSQTKKKRPARLLANRPPLRSTSELRA